MGKPAPSTKTPLLFQSKLLCCSLFYLFIALFLALQKSLSSKPCIFKSSPFHPIQTSLFSYNSSYGEHKYALSTQHSSCSSPVFFSDYKVVFNKIQDLCTNSLAFSPVLKYIEGNSDSFGGNFSIQKRTSYFDHANNSVEIPCGFFKKFPISNSDKTTMETCNGVVVVSAIFNNHDKIRQPRGLGSKTLETVCFFMFVDVLTFQGLEDYQLTPGKSEELKIGAWRIVKVSSKNLYENPAMNGVIAKYLVHRLFPNSKFSIWIDAKLQLNVDPLLLIHALVVSKNVDMAVSKHPFFIHTMEEALATARWKKWRDINALQAQMETYCENGLQPWTPNKLPYPSDVPDSALILRKHGLRSNLFSCLLFNELEAFNPRDQLAFAFVRDKMIPKLKLNMFEEEVFENICVEYRHNIKAKGVSEKGFNFKGNERAKQDLFMSNGSNCQKYLFKMWEGESHY
ncbi:probable hexosyltransferase MUCI70 [Mangifera indica]|uniref:probable hexosyltransferase MUCI70 n=1 Tax=Mangifera indica TaxID=29780 RepID=UPI001CF95ACD|nr:probable hexosyltransferase MUCI70 [Mangifera indica]